MPPACSQPPPSAQGSAAPSHARDGTHAAVEPAAAAAALAAAAAGLAAAVAAETVAAVAAAHAAGVAAVRWGAAAAVVAALTEGLTGHLGLRTPSPGRSPVSLGKCFPDLVSWVCCCRGTLQTVTVAPGRRGQGPVGVVHRCNACQTLFANTRNVQWYKGKDALYAPSPALDCPLPEGKADDSTFMLGQTETRQAPQICRNENTFLNE